MYCIDAVTGQGLWNISFWGLYPVIADGYALSFNYYDGRVYCFGKGPSETTIVASPKVSVFGSSVLIEGTVTDQSEGAKGNPAVSDSNMSKWMEYIYMQQPKPSNVLGVPVELYVLDSNDNYRPIGTTTTDKDGYFSFSWAPDIPGKYTVYATFEGSISYYSSYALTVFNVDPAPDATITPIQPPSTIVEQYFIPVAVGLFILGIIILFMLILSMFKKRE